MVFLVSLPVVFSDDFDPWLNELYYPNAFSATTAVDTSAPFGVVLNTIVGYREPISNGLENVHGLVTSSPLYTDTLVMEGPVLMQGPVLVGPDLVMDGFGAPRHSVIISATGQFPISGNDGSGKITPYLVSYGPGGSQPAATRIDPTRTDTLSTTQHITATYQVVTTYSVGEGNIWLYRAPLVTDPAFSFLDPNVPAESPLNGIHWDGVLRANDFWILAPHLGGMWLYEVNLKTGAVESEKPLGKASPGQAGGLYYPNLVLCADGKRLAGSFPDPESNMQTTFVSDVHATTVVTVTHQATVPDVQALVCVGDIVVLHRADPDGAGVEEVHFNFGNDPPLVRIVKDDSRDVDFSNVFPSLGITYAAGIPVVEVDLPPGSRPIQAEATIRHGWLRIPMFFDTFESGDTSFWSRASGVVP